MDTISLTVATAVISTALLILFLLSGVLVYVPNNRIGIVEKRWSARGSVKTGLIALAGEAGFQPDVLRGGLHFFTPFQYRIYKMPMVTIAQGKIGYIFARDGQALPPTQALAANVSANDFHDVRQFLSRGGQRGPQRQILREGTYAINLVQFVVLTDGAQYFLPLGKDDIHLFQGMGALIDEHGGFEPMVLKGTDDSIGIVTVHDGPSLPQGEIIAPIVGDDVAAAATYHNKFQDPEKFLAAGGMRGRQLQVLVEGTYYINRLFATVELIPKTVIEVGNAGVVVSYTGAFGEDLSGVDYKHGELVQKGRRGVWDQALLPGKYAFNTYAGKVVSVPTTNIILKWNKSESGAHRYDENLSEVSLITKDAFEPLLPLSVVVHIDYRKASLVVQRFGDVKRLVEQTLDPMVSAYFKNVGQTRTLIQLVQDRSSIQQIAGQEMKEKFGMYNLELQEVLIGTPGQSPGDKNIEEILKQLRSRQIAEEQVETYSRMEKAAGKERELREAEAKARAQQGLTESEISITMQSNQGKAEAQRAVQQAAQIKTLAEAEAGKVKTLGEAEASRTVMMASADAERAARVGIAQAIAVEEQVRAYGGPRFQLTQQVMSKFADAIQQSGVDLVPKIVIGGQSQDGKGSGTVLESLLTLLLTERMGEQVGVATTRDPQLEAYAKRIRDQIVSNSGASKTA